MHEDEEATHAIFHSTMSGFVQPSVRRHAGRIVKNTGDGFLAEFASAVEAVRCALEFQGALVRKVATVPEKQRLLFRVGIDVGDIIVEKNDIFGDHVNIAARLEQLAEPGGILISGNVHGYVRDRITCRFEDTGPRQVKNIARPIRPSPFRRAGRKRACRDRCARRAPAAGCHRQGNRGQAPAVRRRFPAYRRAGDRSAQPETARPAGLCRAQPQLRESRERLVGLLWSEVEANPRRVLCCAKSCTICASALPRLVARLHLWARTRSASIRRHRCRCPRRAGGGRGGRKRIRCCWNGSI